MSPVPVSIRRHFLPWDRPLLPQAAAWLADGWGGGAPLDLSRVLVVVPTKQSGRRLREALAEHAAACGQAVFPPRVVTPETLVAEADAPNTATRLESLLAWAQVLHAADAGELAEVFPAGVPAPDAAAALRLAREFAKLQGRLAESGLRFADVAERAATETERWRQLAELEARCDHVLAARGLLDAHAVWINTARAGAVGAGGERVVLLATPDPMPLALAALRGKAEVEVVIFAPESEAAAFDEWGRPAPSAWEKRELVLPDLRAHAHLCGDPGAQAARIAALARSYGQPDGLLAVGLADAEVLPRLETELGLAGVAAFNPEGRLRRGEALHHLLGALAALAREPAFEAVEALARCPDVLKWLRARLGAEFSAARFLEELDELRAEHLPAMLDEARRRADSPALALIAGLAGELGAQPFPRNAVAALAEIFRGVRVEVGREADARLHDAAVAWAQVLRECEAARARFPGLDEGAWWTLALETFGDSAAGAEKPAGALELQGWLELPFEDAPHLVVAGLNDGRVPEAVAGDAFLPESLRARLGLRTNAERFARDAYLLQAIASSRPRLDIFLGKASAAGEPLRPSRLLLRCADAELPARVALLFREPESARANPPWRRAWRLTPRRAEPLERVSVTALRAWLACPFRFHLRHGLRMQAVDPAKGELDAFDFGILCHGALEAMGREAALRDCTDAAELRSFLLGELERRAARRFGDNLTLPLLVQLESARQRLARAAEVQAGERAAGWVIEEVEQKFEVQIAGLTIVGKIDRIDRHAQTGAVRVIDYKSSDQAVSPAGAHLRAIGRGETPAAWLVVECGGKPRAWQDLQLPLYRHALAARLGREVACAYFNLPKAVGETGLAPWDDFTAELQAAAMVAAEAVCAAIRAGEFWPPAELAGRDAEADDFAALFHRGATASVEWGGPAA